MQNGKPLSEEIEEKLNGMIMGKTGIEIKRPWKYLQEIDYYFNSECKDIEGDTFEERDPHVFLVSFEECKCFLNGFKGEVEESFSMKIDYQL